MSEQRWDKNERVLEAGGGWGGRMGGGEFGGWGRKLDGNDLLGDPLCEQYERMIFGRLVRR